MMVPFVLVCVSRRSGDGIIIDYAKTGILPDVYRHACVRTSDEALAAADKIGYPVRQVAHID